VQKWRPAFGTAEQMQRSAALKAPGAGRFCQIQSWMMAHSRTRDREPRITRERVMGGAGTRTCPADFPPHTPPYGFLRHDSNQQTYGRVFFSGRSIMSNALNPADRYCDLAEECRRLAATSLSKQMRGRYSRMAEDYSKLAKGKGVGRTNVRRLAASTAPILTDGASPVA
jgi:hypothetical protein